MVVGIFSRDSPECYQWMVDFLHTFLRATEVEPCLISNNSRIHPNNYTFAILYHSKTRGRVNLTDVTDSLYDEELSVLSRALGKRNVIVVIDDLDNNSDEEKTRILVSQCSIGSMAQELFLFTQQEKLGTDTNHVNSSNKRRMKAIISASRPTSIRMDRHSPVGLTLMDTRFTIIVIVVVLYGLFWWWYNVWVWQW